MTISKASLSASLFYAYDGSKADFPVNSIAETLGLQPGLGDGEFKGDQESVQIDFQSQQAHDSLIVQLTLSLLEGEHDQPWGVLSSIYSELIEQITQKDQQYYPWAESKLFIGSVPSKPLGKFLLENYQGFCEQTSITPKSQQPETTPFGWFWEVNEEELQGKTGKCVWQRDFLLLIPEGRYDKVKALYIDPLNHGFSRIELYCQKCKHLARQHDQAQPEFSRTIKILQDEFLEQIRISDFSQIHAEPVLMEKMSRQMMRFSAQKAAVELLLASLRNNLDSMGDHLNRVKLETPVYKQEIARLERQIEQIEVDLHNADVIQEGTSAIQEIQRSTEGNRFERASYLLGGSAALLAGISLFNSFLDIWSLVLGNTSWVLPPAWMRISLSLIASITISLEALWLISRKKPHFVIGLLVSLAALGAMFFSTYLLNI
jgi:hypothetical protein